MNPTNEADRIESLDVLRGFALLGILLLNIVGFALPASAYSFPASWMHGAADWAVWMGIELFAEGAMRCLFSMLFGAGVVLLAAGPNGKDAATYYKRNFWLLVFGLVDAYLLLWNGDILINYALAGFVLYWACNASPRRLLISAAALIVLLSAFYGVTEMGMQASRAAAAELAVDSSEAGADTRALAQMWQGFESDYAVAPQALADELEARRGSYVTAFLWNLPVTNEMLLFVTPMYLFWDALAMMLLGMALFKYGVLQGARETGFYLRLAVVGLVSGLTVNGWELWRASLNDFDLLSTFAQMQATYHLGRLGVACFWLGLLMWLIKSGAIQALRRRLAAVGRMALTNYLSHSLICLLLFTGAGLGLVGQFDRAQIYGFVALIWVFQLWFSPWWLARYRFGPVEWLWRGLTYGRFPANARASNAT